METAHLGISQVHDETAESFLVEITEFESLAE